MPSLTYSNFVCCLVVYGVVLCVTGAAVKLCTIDITGTGFYQLAKHVLTASHRPTIVKAPVARMLLPATVFMDQSKEKHRGKANSAVSPLSLMLFFHLIFSTSTVRLQTFQKLFKKLPFRPSLQREVGLDCKGMNFQLFEDG